MNPESKTEAQRLAATAHRQLSELDQDIDMRLRSAQVGRDERRTAELEAIQTSVRRVRTLVEELGRALGKGAR